MIRITVKLSVDVTVKSIIFLLNWTDNSFILCCGNCSLFHIISINWFSFSFSVLPPPCLCNSVGISWVLAAWFSVKLLFIKHISLCYGSGVWGYLFVRSLIIVFIYIASDILRIFFCVQILIAWFLLLIYIENNSRHVIITVVSLNAT